MPETAATFSSLFTSHHGSILVHVILLIPILITAQYLWVNRKQYEGNLQKRYGIGVTVAIALQSLALFTNIVFSSTNPPTQIFLAVIERTTTAATLLVFPWLWMPEKKQRLGDFLYGTLLVISFVIMIFTLFSPGNNNQSIFNATWPDFIWQTFSLGIAIISFVLCTLFKPARWKWMFLFCGIQLAAFLLHITLILPAGYFSPIIRPAQILAYLLIPASFISQTSVATDEQDEESNPLPKPIISEVDDAPDAITEPKMIPVMDYDILQHWTNILTEDRPEKVLASVCRALAHTLKADLCYILSGDPDQKELLLQGGYDLIREVDKIGGTIKKNRVPAIAKALQNEENLQLTIEEEETEDIRALRSLLQLDSETNLLLLPMGHLGHTQNAVLLLSPYSKRIWSKEEQTKTKPITEHINDMFDSLSRRTQTEFKKQQLEEQVAELEIANQDWQRQFEEIHQEYENETQVNENLKLEIRNFEEKLAGMVEKTQYENIAIRHQQNQSELERLQNNNEELKQQLEELKAAFFDVEKSGSSDQLPAFNGSNEVESMLAIQLESQEVITRLHQENQELQQELDAFSSSKNIQHAVLDMPVETRSLYDTKKYEWLQSIQQAKYDQSQHKIDSLSEQLQKLMEQINNFSLDDEKNLHDQMESWKNNADYIQEVLAATAISDSQLTFPLLLDDIFENLNEIVMKKDLTLRVDIPDGMTDIPIHDDMISHLLKTLLQDLVNSLEQDNWLSIKIEKQFTNLIIHVSLGCTETLQQQLLDILNRPQISDEDIDSFFGLVLTKDIIQSLHGMIESTENTTEQTNLFIRLPIN
jgi:hypothetical protein